MLALTRFSDMHSLSELLMQFGIVLLSCFVGVYFLCARALGKLSRKNICAVAWSWRYYN